MIYVANVDIELEADTDVDAEEMIRVALDGYYTIIREVNELDAG